MIPSLGRIVHYTLPEGHPNAGGHRAAIITAVYKDAKGSVSAESAVDLRANLQPREPQGPTSIGPDGFIDALGVVQDKDGLKFGTWHEPEREVPAAAAAPAAATKPGDKA
jgi:hypothetical protein